METNKNDSKQLGLAAVMFFNIMVKNFIKNNEGEFSQEEKKFIQSYIQYGYFSIISGLITIILVILYYFYPSTLLYWVHTLSIITTLAVVIVGSIGVLSGSILYHKEDGLQYVNINEEKDKIILYFIPLYNVIVRYNTHQFDKPNLWLKESLLRWTLWVIIGIMQSQILLVFRTVLIIIRVVTIAAGIDIMQDKIKAIVQQAFSINPEELRSYAIATIDFITQKIQQKIIQPSRKELLLAYKKTYSHLHPIDTTIVVQYSIGGLLITAWIWSIYESQNNILYASILIILGRYIIMYKKRKHLPPLPLAREIHLFAVNLYNRITRK